MKMSIENIEQNDSKEENQLISSCKPTAIKTVFKCSTEDELVHFLKRNHASAEGSRTVGYYNMGRGILSYYKKKYGQNELQRIATKTEIGISTLEKICRFASSFSQDQVQILCSGRFSISWRNIAQNLALGPEMIIEVYRSSNNLMQFRNAVRKLKNPLERRGKSEKKKLSREISMIEAEKAWKKERENLLNQIDDIKEELEIKDNYILELKSGSMLKKLFSKNKKLTEENEDLNRENERLIKEVDNKEKEKKEYQKIKMI